MDEAGFEDYVRAAARLAGLAPDAGQIRRVAQHLARTAELAARLDALALDATDEPAQLYCPAPFPGATVEVGAP